MHKGFINEYVKVTTVINDTCWQESRHHYRMLALFDEADYIAVDTSYPGSLQTYGDFSSQPLELPRGWKYRFYLANGDSIKRGEIYDLKFKLTPNKTTASEYTASKIITEESLAFHDRTLRAEFETVFIGEIPSTIWHFSGLGAHERPGKPTKNNRLEFNGPSAVAEFRDLYGGLYSGVAWDWREI